MNQANFYRQKALWKVPLNCKNMWFFIAFGHMKEWVSDWRPHHLFVYPSSFCVSSFPYPSHRNTKQPSSVLNPFLVLERLYFQLALSLSSSTNVAQYKWKCLFPSQGFLLLPNCILKWLWKFSCERHRLPKQNITQHSFHFNIFLKGSMCLDP